MLQKAERQQTTKLYNVLTIFVLLCISAGAYSLAFNSERLSWLAFVALLPFFIAITRTGSIAEAGICGFLFGFFLSHSSGYFVYYALIAHFNKPALISALFFIICIALPVAVLYTIFGVAFRLLYKNNLFFFSILLPCLWVLTEYIKEVFPFLIPWGNLAYAVPSSAFHFIQTADIAGCYGVLFLIILINGLLTFISIQTYKNKGIIRKIYPGLIIMSLLIITQIYGEYKINRVRGTMAKSNPFKVTVVQGNYSNIERWSGTGFLSRIKRYILMSKMTDSPLIVWPETVINAPEKTNTELFNTINESIGKGSVLIAGGVRKTNKTYNSAFIVSKKEKLTIDHYDKNILLPWVETGILPIKFYTAPKAFDKGNSSPVRKTPVGKVGISICLEILYPDYAMYMVESGSRFLVNISNDTWFGKSQMPRIHLNAAILRAIETRRSMVRASNSGISAVISPTGEILKQTGLYKQGKVTEKIYPSDTISIYASYGNIIVWFSFVTIFFALAWIVRGQAKESL